MPSSWSLFEVSLTLMNDYCCFTIYAEYKNGNSLKLDVAGTKHQWKEVDFDV